MALSGLNQNINEFGTGAVAGTNDNTAVLIGYSSLGTGETAYSFGDVGLIKTTLGYGPLVAAASHILSAQKSGSIVCIPVVSDVAGTVSAVVKSGTGTPTMTVAGTPNDNTQFVVKIILGGAIATSTFQYSIDAGLTWSATMLTASTYLIPNSGITVSMPAGTYVAGDTYSFSSVAPGYSSTKLQTAFAAYMNQSLRGKGIYCVGQPADISTAATFATAAQVLAESAFAANVPGHVYIELPYATDSAINTAFANVVAPRVIACADFCDILSETNGKVEKRPSAFAIVARAMSVSAHEDLGYVGRGSLSANGVIKLYRDEKATPGLADRFTVLRTRNEKAGFFIETGKTLAAANSDLQWLTNRRVIDNVCDITAQSLVDYINADLDLQLTGTLKDAAKAMIQDKVIANVEALCGKSVSAFRFSISQANNMTLDPKLYCTLQILPKGYARFIQVDYAFTKSLVAA